MIDKSKKDITELRRNILLMGGHVEKHVANAFQSMVDGDRELASKVRGNDDVINEMELNIEDECLDILALDHPVASDLRFVLCVLRINTNLERIADLAVGVAKRGSKITKACETYSIPHAIPQMMRTTTTMLHNAIESLAHEDPQLARAVRESDDIVDELRKKVLSWAQSHAAELTATSISLITIATKIERIADMATNIAEDVIFAVEGEIVRHS